MLSCLLMVPALVKAQELKSVSKVQLGITYSSYGYSDFGTIRRQYGGTTYDGIDYAVTGLAYVYHLDDEVSLESGLQWARHKLIRFPYAGPNDEQDSVYRPLNLLTVPMVMRFVPKKYFFWNAGVFLGLELKGDDHFDNQSGIGTVVGFGWKYEFKEKIELYLNPEFRWYSVVPFYLDQNHHRLMEVSLRMGLLYRLPEN